MKLEHIAIWTTQLEALKDFYITYFHGVAGPKYRNEKKQFESYFLSFQGGARLEIMQMPSVQSGQVNHPAGQRVGLTHIAFEVESRNKVDGTHHTLLADGLPIVDGPRVTGDGYYEFTTLDPDGNRVEVTCRMTQHHP